MGGYLAHSMSPAFKMVYKIENRKEKRNITESYVGREVKREGSYMKIQSDVVCSLIYFEMLLKQPVGFDHPITVKFVRKGHEITSLYMPDRD